MKWITRTSGWTVLALSVSVLFAPPALGVIYGIDDQNVWSIEPDTCTVLLLNSFPGPDLWNAAAGPTLNTLFVTTENGDYYEFDISSGVFSLIAPGLLPARSANSLTEGRDGFWYAGTSQAGELFRVDPVAQSSTLIGSGGSDYSGDLAANFSGDLFGMVRNGNLVSVSKVDGSQTPVGNTGIFELGTGLAFSADGRLWVGTMLGKLYEIDPLTANATLKCTFSFSLGDLASEPVPTQCQLAKLTGGDATTCDRCGDAFGVSVSIDGDFIAVGAPDGLPGAPPSAIPGATYIFRREGIGWIEEAKIVPDDAEPNDSIGGKVSISGNRVLMGALGRDGFTGAAYIFRREGTTWVQEAKLTATDADVGDTFSIGLCLSGDVAVVGAWGDDEAGADAGAAYVFRRDDNGTPLDPSDDIWPQEAKLIPNDAAPGDLLGVGCSIGGNRIVVGATQCNPGRYCGARGKAYVFRYDGTNWVQEAKLTASDGASDDNFGLRTVIDGDTILVSAWAHDAACNTCLSDSDCSGNCGGNCTEGCEPGCCTGCCNTSEGTCIECNSGAVYVFQRTGTTWVETQKLTALDTGEGDNFGKDVALRGNLAVVGADGDDGFGFNTGAAYIFRREGNVWIEESKLTANDPDVSDRLGFSVSLSGGFVVAGAFNDDDACPTDSGCNSGSAYVFDLVGADCNDNGICDRVDIAEGTSNDVNVNGVPDECEEAGCGTLLVQVNEHTVGGGQGSTIVGIEGLQLCVFDKSPGSCARNIGISRRHYPEIFTTCDSVACETTDADGAAGIILEAGDYVLIGEYDPDGFPPNNDGDEVFIGVSAGDFQCAADGDPNTVTMRKHLQVIILPNGRMVRVNPRAGGSGRSTENEWVEITNVGGPDDSISVTAVDEDLLAGVGPYTPTGKAIGIDSSLSPEQLFMTVAIPFHAEDLSGDEPLSVDLTYYNRSTGSWELAVGGNDQPSPDHGLDVMGDRFAIVGSTIPVLSGELGDYGVFWNPDLQEGFVWANVDYTGEFANARQTQSAPVPTVSEWGLIVMGLLLLAGAKVYFGRRRERQRV